MVRTAHPTLLTMKCIYCCKDKNPGDYLKREHIIPQCFGTFADNLILREIVCDECNQYFGENLELCLGRDTIEGIFRYQAGIKPRKSPKKHKRLQFKIPTGELSGMIVLPKYSGEKNGCNIEPVLQVGFFHKDNCKYNYFEPKDILTAKELQEKGYDLFNERRIQLIAKTEEEEKYLLKVLKDKGMDIRIEGEMDWPEIVKERNKTLVEGIARIDRIIYRGISKIAFNYLAYIEGRDFVLSENFDGVRNFIRNDNGRSDDYFAPNEKPILYDDRALQKHGIAVTNGHLIIVEWRGPNLIGKVSLFNLATYMVKFCKIYNGIWRPIRSGHHFDLNSKRISKLTAVNRRLIP